MSRHELRTIISQHESRISRLEKRQAQRQADVKNGAHIPSTNHLEGPLDLLKTVEEGMLLIRNATGSLDVAKGRALASIAVKARGILPLVEAATAQAEEDEEKSRYQRALFEIVSGDPRKMQVISDGIDLDVEVNKLAESYAREGEKKVAESDDTCEGDEEGWGASYEGKE